MKTWLVIKNGSLLREIQATSKRAALLEAKRQYGGKLTIVEKDSDTAF